MAIVVDQRSAMSLTPGVLVWDDAQTMALGLKSLISESAITEGSRRGWLHCLVCRCQRRQRLDVLAGIANPHVEVPLLGLACLAKYQRTL